jgi:hypothetical protein
MSYRIVKGEAGAFSIALTDEPPYCHALPMAPAAMEPELGQGLWLVLVLAVWSMPDRQSPRVALEVIKALGGTVQLGLRPMNAPEETAVWCPEATASGTPQWLLLRDGRLVAERTGLLDAAALGALLAQHHE